MPEPMHRTDLRLPERLWTAIERMAAREHRSINAQLLVIIESAIAQEAGK